MCLRPCNILYLRKSVRNYTIRYGTTLYSPTLYCITLYYTVSSCATPHYTILYHPVPHHTTLFCIILCHITPRHTIDYTTSRRLPVKQSSRTVSVVRDGVYTSEQSELPLVILRTGIMCQIRGLDSMCAVLI